MADVDDPWIESLLRQAEAMPPVAPTEKVSAESLLRAVQQRRTRQTVTRAAVVAGIGVVMATLATVDPFTLHDRAPQPALVVAKLSVDELRAELALLDRQAAMHRAIVDELTAVEHEPDANEAVPQPWAAEVLLRAETLRSAGISWQYASYVETELEDLPSAEQEYRRVVERFPDTTWAAVAADSLHRLQTSAGDRSSL